jgi:ABC-type glycerol-3-phosphate transport system substrate-binding protein
MIPNDAKSPDVAWQLAEHLTSNESIDIIFDGCGFLLVTKDFLKDPSSVVDVNKYEGLDFYINSLNEADEITSWPACPIDSFVWDQFAKALNAAIYNEKSAEQALADLQKACTEELASALS